MSDETQDLKYVNYWPDLDPGTQFVIEGDQPCHYATDPDTGELVLTWADWQVATVIDTVDLTKMYLYGDRTRVYRHSHNPEFDKAARRVAVIGYV